MCLIPQRIPASLLVLFFFATISCTSTTHKSSVGNHGLILPETLEAELWAESPLLYNPTQIDVDSRGRVWVTEAANYRNFKNDSTTHFHHRGGDRVVILEDRDQDGKADTAITFVQDPDLVAPVGIAVLGNKVYVSCSPNLIVYTDDNGDDKPDHKEILLTGFGGLDHDHSLHAVYGGPDGLLYFNTGNSGPHIVTDKSGFTLRSGSLYIGGTPYSKKNEPMVSDDGKKWVGGLALRMNPDGKKMKVVGHNFRNAYEVFPDSYGNLWQNDNDDQVLTCRVTWLMEGGNAGYFSTDGTRYWQADQRPGQDIFTAHWHQNDPGVMPAGFNTGAGSPTGVMRIENDLLGKEYNGVLLSADAGRNMIFGFRPEPSKSGLMPAGKMNFVSSIPEDNELYVWNDSVQNSDKKKWFRPSDMAQGIDGSLFIADWYDPVVGGHQMNDSTGYGRIYRIHPKGVKLVKPVIDLETLPGQIKSLSNPAINVRFTAAQKIRQQGADAVDQVAALLNSSDGFLKARAIWILSDLSDKGIAIVEKQLSDKDPEIRITAIRALKHAGANIFPIVEKMENDQSPAVRRELIAAITDSSFELKKKPLLALAKQYTAGDRWYLETLGAAMDTSSSFWFDTLKSVMRTGNTDDAHQWTEAMAEITWRIHPVNAASEIAARAADPALNSQQRHLMLTALAFINSKEAVNQMAVLTADKDSTIAEEARYWLSFRQSNDWFSLADWSKIGVDTRYERKMAYFKVKQQIFLDERQSDYERRSGTRALALDSVGGRILIAMVAGDKLPTKIKTFATEFIFKNPDPAVRIQAGRYFERPGLKGSFNIDSILAMQQDPQKGKAIFQSNCAVCHRIDGLGNTIGPDLSEVKKKFDAESILDAIINPDGAIAFGYEAWLVNTKEGPPMYGFLLSQDKKFVVIKDISGEKRSIETSKITSIKKQDKGLMPDPGSMGLSQKDLADIVGYIIKKN